MARRKARRVVARYGSDSTASEVIKRFIEKYRLNGENWKRGYSEGIEKYVTDENKKADAKTKLVVWYDLLLDNSPRIGGIFRDMRNAYDQKLNQLRQQGLLKTEKPIFIEVTGP